jgi:hypothetical protein
VADTQVRLYVHPTAPDVTLVGAHICVRRAAVGAPGTTLQIQKNQVLFEGTADGAPPAVKILPID